MKAEIEKKLQAARHGLTSKPRLIPGIKPFAFYGEERTNNLSFNTTPIRNWLTKGVLVDNAVGLYVGDLGWQIQVFIATDKGEFKTSLFRGDTGCFHKLDTTLGLHNCGKQYRERFGGDIARTSDILRWAENDLGGIVHTRLVANWDKRIARSKLQAGILGGRVTLFLLPFAFSRWINCSRPGYVTGELFTMSKISVVYIPGFSHSRVGDCIITGSLEAAQEEIERGTCSTPLESANSVLHEVAKEEYAKA